MLHLWPAGGAALRSPLQWGLSRGAVGALALVRSSHWAASRGPGGQAPAACRFHRPGALADGRFLAVAARENFVAVFASPSRRFVSGGPSFIRTVLDQVKQEMESNEELRRSVEELKKAGLVEQSQNLREKARSLVGTLSEVAGAVGAGTAEKVKSSAEKLADLQKKALAGSAAARAASSAAAAALSATKKVAGAAAAGADIVADAFKDEKAEAAKRRAEAWRKERERDRAARAAAGDGSGEPPAPGGGGDGVDAAGLNGGDAAGPADAETAAATGPSDAAGGNTEDFALIVAQDSAWERFGTRLRDMPFLQSFFENPVLGQLFGESQQAAAIRAMKQADPSFRLHELVDLVQHVVAPHLLDCFLRGDKEPLQRQCGVVAFAAISHSIKEREALGLKLDPTVLLLRNVEFRSAIPVEDSLPWFVFTFSAQQINCLRDKHDKVIVGAIDDIREVVYSIALVKHPEPELENLEYPWQVAEFALIGNEPCW